MNPSPLTVDVVLDDAGTFAAMAGEVREGLLGSPKQIPSKYFYDDLGSGLFERITRLPEYYLTRAETALVERHAPELARAAASEDLIELGPGSTRKTRLLLDAMSARGALRRYVPFEVSAATVERLGREILQSHPDLEVHAVVGDFQRHLDRIPPGGRRLVAFLGSTVGNLLEAEAVLFLTGVARLLRDGGQLLLGTDLVKDTRILEAAYNDSQGVTAEFNRNILLVLNRRLQGDFDPRAFEHVAFYDEAQERIEMHLRSLRDQKVALRAIDLEIPFKTGEMVRTEVSCKYTRGSVETILKSAGLVLGHWFTDAEGTFALSLSRPA